MKNKLIIRLQRCGRIQRPFFNIVVCYKKQGPSGACLAKIGYFDPFSTKGAGFKPIVLYKNLLNFWISKGATPNDTVRKLLF